MQAPDTPTYMEAKTHTPKNQKTTFIVRNMSSFCGNSDVEGRKLGGLSFEIALTFGFKTTSSDLNGKLLQINSAFNQLFNSFQSVFSVFFNAERKVYRYNKTVAGLNRIEAWSKTFMITELFHI